MQGNRATLYHGLRRHRAKSDGNVPALGEPMWKVALSKWVNHHIFGGSPREMLSSRCLREKRIKAVSWLDWLAFWHDDHCWRCYQWQLNNGDYGYAVRDGLRAPHTVQEPEVQGVGAAAERGQVLLEQVSTE